MREAVNYAVDRRRLAQLIPGSALPDRPADHYLPPGMPGYNQAHVYPLGGDLAKAKALARGVHRSAVLYTCSVGSCIRQAKAVKADLAAIGIRVDIHAFPFAELFARIARPGEPFDI